MSELSNYSEAVSLAKSILHGPCDETMADAGRIIRFMASQETEDVPDLLAEIERLRKLAHEILEGYDDCARRVIDEVVGTGRELTISYHEFLIKSYQNEIDGKEETE
jgi:hypothetical protein